jgi:hypothetical protein
MLMLLFQVFVRLKLIFWVNEFGKPIAMSITSTHYSNPKSYWEVLSQNEGFSVDHK